jgi:hypothetical protein
LPWTINKENSWLNAQKALDKGEHPLPPLGTLVHVVDIHCPPQGHIHYSSNSSSCVGECAKFPVWTHPSIETETQLFSIHPIVQSLPLDQNFLSARIDGSIINDTDAMVRFPRPKCHHARFDNLRELLVRPAVRRFASRLSLVVRCRAPGTVFLPPVLLFPTIPTLPRTTTLRRMWIRPPFPPTTLLTYLLT